MAPDMKIDYYARTTLGGFWRQNWSNGVWAILPFAHVSGIVMGWRHLAPLAFVLGLMASATAAWATGAAWLGSVVAVPYLAGNLAASAHAAWKEGSPTLALKMPLVFAGLHVAYGAGSLWGCVRLAKLLLEPKSRQSPQSPETAQ